MALLKSLETGLPVPRAAHPAPIRATKEWTAKTVNEELVSLVKSCERINKRREALGRKKRGDYPTHEAWVAACDQWKKLAVLLERQQATLDAAIVAGMDGRVSRHRGEIAGQRLERFSARKAKVKARKIVALHPIIEAPLKI